MPSSCFFTESSHRGHLTFSLPCSALYTVLQQAVSQIVYLEKSVAVVLGFVGAKMVHSPPKNVSIIPKMQYSLPQGLAGSTSAVCMKILKILWRS